MEDDAQSRRRRGAGVVTANACTECRKKRSKCDGQTPCQRCATQNVECIYSIPVRQSKENMRTEIEQLANHRQQSERVFSAISSGGRAQETLNRLRNGESLESISNWLENSSSHPAGGFGGITTFPPTVNQSAFGPTLRLAESAGRYAGFGGSSSSEGPSSAGQQVWSNFHSSEGSRQSSTPIRATEGDDVMNWVSERQSPTQDEQQSSTHPGHLSSRLVSNWEQGDSIDFTDTAVQNARGRGQRHIFGPSYTENDTSFAGRSWTTVTDNRALVEHLMSLYFCWEYPTFASLSKEHFITDFQLGRPRYCSSLLVNAMLALGCRFSTLPESRADPKNVDTAGDHYFAEAKRLLAEDDMKSLTSIQALGLISIREASCGRDSESYYYAGQAVRLASEFGLHSDAADYGNPAIKDMDLEVRAATFWGAFALDQAWCLSIGQLPHFSRCPDLVEKPSIVQAIESSEWVPYTDQGAPEIKAANQPSNVRSVYKCFCELSELVHQSLYTLYTPVRPLTSNEILSIYTRYLNWYSSLPEALRLGTNFTPAVLFVHMYYHFAILLLFRPFIKLRFIGSAITPRSVCAQAADAITTLVRSYDQLYTLQRTPSFVPYIVLASGIMHLVLGPNGSDDSEGSTIQHNLQGIDDLKDMCSCHGFSQRGLNIIRFLAKHWGINRTPGEEGSVKEGEDFEKLRALCQPAATSANMFCPDMGDMFIGLGPAGKLALFSPFPMQGLPWLTTDEGLESHGFARA